MQEQMNQYFDNEALGKWYSDIVNTGDLVAVKVSFQGVVGRWTHVMCILDDLYVISTAFFPLSDHWRQRSESNGIEWCWMEESLYLEN